MTEFFISPIIILIMVMGWLVVGAVVLIAVTSQNRRRAALQEAALARGWTFDYERKGRRVTTRLGGNSSGVLWTIEVVYVRSSGSSGSGRTFTRWSTDRVTLPDEAVFVGPPMSGNVPDSFDMNNPLVKFGLRMTLRALLEDDPGDMVKVFDRIYRVDAGTDTFREHYTVLATDEEQAHVLVQALESPLIDWSLGHKKRNLPSVMLWGRGLLVKFNDRILDLARLDEIVQLGVRLAEAVEGEQGW